MYNDNLVRARHYLKTLESLLQYCGDEPALDNYYNIVNFPGNSDSSKSKLKITGKALVDGNTKVKIAVPLKYLRTR